MKLLRLEVENFRGVRSAKLDFAPGVNVLHGPNELGKSTLADALRAALLMPKSVLAEPYRPWGDEVPTRVTLTFEHDGHVWRVRKKFDHPYNAVLEQQSAGTSEKFHKVAEGRLVDDKLRELLGWGLAKLGGRGTPPKPISYLVVALLGQQGKVDEILGSSLDNDAETSGTVSITKALGALGSDPRVAAIVERLSERVDAVFTPTGKLKATADSPLFRLHQKVQGAGAALEVLRADEVTSQTVAATVVSAHEEWLRLSAELREAEDVLQAARLRHEQNKARQQLQGEIDECRARLDQAEQLSVRLGELRGGLVAAVETERAERAALVAAGLAVEGLSAQVQQASEDVVRAQSASREALSEDEASRHQRRGVLIAQKALVESRVREVNAADVSAVALSTAESALTEAATSLDAAKANRERAVERVALQLQRASEEARRREDAAAAALAHAEAELAAAESHRLHKAWISDPTLAALAAEIDRLEAAELHLRVVALRSRIATLEGDDDQRTRSLNAASQKRDEASRLEQQATASDLPTAERVAEWREWEAELGADAPAARKGLAAGVVASLIAAGAGAVVAATAFLMDAGSTATAATAFVAALLAGALAWQRASTRERVAETGLEKRKLQQERLAREVRPAMRRANLPSLAAFEGARDALVEMKSQAGLLRIEAGQDDQEAARLAAQVAPLEGLRHQLIGLMRDDGRMNPDDFTQVIEECGGDVVQVRARLNDRQAQRSVLEATLSQAADAAVVAAQELCAQKRSLHISALSAEAPMAVEAVTVDLERAKDDVSKASAKADELRRQVDALRPAAAQHLTNLGEDPASARSKAEAELADIETQLAALNQPSNDLGADAARALAAAERRRDELNVRLAEAKSNVELAEVAASAAAESMAAARTQVASAEGELKAIERADLHARLLKASQDPVFQEPDAGGPDLGAATEQREFAQATLHGCEGRLNAAKGQLHLVGGHAVAERRTRQEEVVAFVRQEIEEKELTERAAFRLLTEIRGAEAEATSNLGRTLSGPVTEMLKELTGGRYGAVEFTTDLTAAGVAAAGSSRELEHLSVGTREQLATLVRLAIAAQLQTTLVLDDQLVHSDTERLSWFRERLCASAHDRQHQIVVFTCRPGDYLSPDGAEGTQSVNVVDLSAVVDALRVE